MNQFVRSLLLGTVNATTFAVTGVTAGTSQAIDCTPFDTLTIYFKGVGTVTGGTILVEEADWNPDTEQVYTGTWSAITTHDASATALTNLQVAYHPFAPAGYSWVRVRIGSAITGGGAVSVVLKGVST